jgi:hypothetical protein
MTNRIPADQAARRHRYETAHSLDDLEARDSPVGGTL